MIDSGDFDAGQWIGLFFVILGIVLLLLVWVPIVLKATIRLIAEHGLFARVEDRLLGDAEDALDSQTARERFTELASGKAKLVSGDELDARLARGITMTDSTRDIIELLADVEHERWSGWMRYSLDKMTRNNTYRWRRQMVTPYAELPEHSKESDRAEVRKTVQALKDAGYVIVPKKPTDEMKMAGAKLRAARYAFGVVKPRSEEIWQAMIDAALGE